LIARTVERGTVLPVTNPRTSFLAGILLSFSSLPPPVTASTGAARAVDPGAVVAGPIAARYVTLFAHVEGRVRAVYLKTECLL
jgi:hypothetical protein